MIRALYPLPAAVHSHFTLRVMWKVLGGGRGPFYPRHTLTWMHTRVHMCEQRIQYLVEWHCGLLPDLLWPLSQLPRISVRFFLS